MGSLTSKYDPVVLAPYLSGDFSHSWAPRKLVQIAVSHPPLFAPGTDESYSSTNYLLAGLIIEARTGNTLGSELIRRIFQPLHLSATSFPTTARIANPHAHGYLVIKKPPATDVTGLYPFPWAAGAIVSNAADTATFYRALLSGRLLSPKLLHAMQTTHPQKHVDIPGQRYGLGLIRYSTSCGTAWGHNGAYPGYYVYDFTSSDGQRQAVIEVNADPTSVSKTTGLKSIRLLGKAYCSGRVTTPRRPTEAVASCRCDRFLPTGTEETEMTGSLAPARENSGSTTRFIRALSRRVAASRRETTFAVAAIAAMSVHLLDDNFVQPQAGTSAADHLSSGLVPLAALVAFAAAYARLHAGLRAAIALPLGVFGVVAGAGEAGYYTLNGGPAGDDYTGLLALTAGILLLGIGATTLWRSRRTNDRLVRRYARRLAKTAVVAVAGYVVLFPLALSYVFTHSARAVVPAAKLGVAHENVTFTTSDGLTLRGWYVPAKNRAAVIAAPGRVGSQKQARMLIRHGYGVLLFDRRGEGDSDGDPNAFGWAADKDMNAALAYLQQRPDVDRNRIGGIGLSVGGETLLQTAAESDGLKAVVADGAGSRSLREDLARTGGNKWGEIPTSLVITAGTMLFANQVPPPNLKSLVGRISPRPVFFIYGEHDQDNVRELTPGYYANAGEPKAIWEVAGAAHTGGIDAHPRQYERRIVAFFDHALLQPR